MSFFFTFLSFTHRGVSHNPRKGKRSRTKKYEMRRKLGGRESPILLKDKNDLNLEKSFWKNRIIRRPFYCKDSGTQKACKVYQEVALGCGRESSRDFDSFRFLLFVQILHLKNNRESWEKTLCVWKCFSKISYMAGRLQKSFAGACGPLVAKKARNRVKSSKASDGHHFHLPINSHSKSQGSVKSNCRIQPYRTLENLNTTSFSTSILCTRCGAWTWYGAVSKQTNEQKINRESALLSPSCQRHPHPLLNPFRKVRHRQRDARSVEGRFGGGILAHARVCMSKKRPAASVFSTKGLFLFGKPNVWPLKTTFLDIRILDRVFKFGFVGFSPCRNSHHFFCQNFPFMSLFLGAWNFVFGIRNPKFWQYSEKSSDDNS